MSIPLSHAFFKNPLLSKPFSASYDAKASNSLKNSILLNDQSSNSEIKNKNAKTNETINEILFIEGILKLDFMIQLPNNNNLALFIFNFKFYLFEINLFNQNFTILGFDSINESYDEIRARTKIDSYLSKKRQSNLSIKGKSSNTKYSDNPFVSEDPDDSECNCSIDSEGGANTVHMYFMPSKTLSKHKSFTAKVSTKLDCRPARRLNQIPKLLRDDYNKLYDN